MTNNERMLLDIIRKSDNQEQALVTAFVVILGLLMQLESFAEQAVDSPRGLG